MIGESSNNLTNEIERQKKKKRMHINKKELNDANRALQRLTSIVVQSSLSSSPRITSSMATSQMSTNSANLNYLSRNLNRQQTDAVTSSSNMHNTNNSKTNSSLNYSTSSSSNAQTSLSDYANNLIIRDDEQDNSDYKSLMSSIISSNSKRDLLLPMSTNSLAKDSINSINNTHDKGLLNTSKSIEYLLNCEMFNKLYNLNKKINHLKNRSNFLNSEYENNLSIESDEIEEEDEEELESDDSYAARFNSCIRKVIVYSSSACNKNAKTSLNKILNYSAVFRVVCLRNRRTNKSYLFLLKKEHKLINPNRSDELWLYWSNDEENGIRSNDQLLCINGIYINEINCKTALNLLFDGQKYNCRNQATESSRFKRFELLVSRNIDKRLIKKNLKKPKYDLTKNILLSSSSSTISSLSLATTDDLYVADDCLFLETKRQQLQERREQLRNASYLLIYDSNNGSIHKTHKLKFNETIFTNKDMMVLHTEWTQLETIELLNETFATSSSSSTLHHAKTLLQVPSVSSSSSASFASTSGGGGGSSGGNGGFGFGITGNKSTGVVIKVITPGGSAHKDGRLRVNDQIFQIGDTNVRNMSSEQVAAVLRQSSLHGQLVKFVVARPVLNSVNDIEMLNENKSSEIVVIDPATIKVDDDVNLISSDNGTFLVRTSQILDKKLNLNQLIQAEMDKQQPTNASNKDKAKEDEKTLKQENVADVPEKLETKEQKKEEKEVLNPVSTLGNTSTAEPVKPTQTSSTGLNIDNDYKKNNANQPIESNISDKNEKTNEPDVYLVKITRRADVPAVNNESTNQNDDENRQFINNLNEFLRFFSIKVDKDEEDEEFYITEKFLIKNEEKDTELNDINIYDKIVKINHLNINLVKLSQLKSAESLEISLKRVEFDFVSKKLQQKWFKILRNDNSYLDESLKSGNYEMQIVVGEIDKSKSKSLGISLEGTVDVDDNGVETFPHHYIRSIMKDGPVDKCACHFKQGDELLEIDYCKLFGINYLELLNILKSLQLKRIILVCLRKIKPSKTKRAKSECFLGNSNNLSSSETNSQTDLNMKSLIEPQKISERASSSIALPNQTTTTTAIASSSAQKTVTCTKSTPNIIEPTISNNKTQNQKQLYKTTSTKLIKTPQLCIRSRSLELNGLALWNKEVNYIELMKNEKGLGFSLIDYQYDPFNPLSKTVIVIRALVPNGVAQTDGRLIPGQRLVSINDVLLDEDLLETRSSNSSLTKCFDLLKFTVDYLKSLPIGKLVVLGVQKPLPYPDADLPCLPKSVEINQNKPSVVEVDSTTNASALVTNEIENNKIDKSESDRKKQKSNKNLNKENSPEYGFVATSAPAILHQKHTKLDDPSKKLSQQQQKQQQDDGENHLFYSSSSLIKLNTIELYNQVYKEASSKTCSTLELKSISNEERKQQQQQQQQQEKQKLLETNKLDNQTKSNSTAEVVKEEELNLNQKCIKQENQDSTLLTTTNATNKSSDLKISKIESEPSNEKNNYNSTGEAYQDHLLLKNDEIAQRIANSSVFLNFLLNNDSNSKKLLDDSLKWNENKQLITEEQFNEAFILNTNKKLINLIESNQLQDNYQQEILNLSEICNKQEQQKQKNENANNGSSLIRDIQHNENNNQSTGKKLKEKKSKNKNISSASYVNKDIEQHRDQQNQQQKIEKQQQFYLTEMVKDMASFNWPHIDSTDPEHSQIDITNSDTAPIKGKHITFNNIPSTSSCVNVANALKKPKRDHSLNENLNQPISKTRSSSGTRSYNEGIYSGIVSSCNTSRLRSTSRGNRSASRSGSVRVINILGKEIIKLPAQLEQEIKIKKNYDPLGISSVDCTHDEGINGCTIVKIEANTACSKDNRLKIGDYLLSVNNEQMRNSTNASAKAILNRASLTCNDVVIRYIPAREAKKYKKNFLKEQKREAKSSKLEKRVRNYSSSSRTSRLKSSCSTSVTSLSSSSCSSSNSLSKSASSSAISSSLSDTCNSPDLASSQTLSSSSSLSISSSSSSPCCHCCSYSSSSSPISSSIQLDDAKTAIKEADLTSIATGSLSNETKADLSTPTSRNQSDNLVNKTIKAHSSHRKHHNHQHHHHCHLKHRKHHHKHNHSHHHHCNHHHHCKHSKHHHNQTNKHKHTKRSKSNQSPIQSRNISHRHHSSHSHHHHHQQHKQQQQQQQISQNTHHKQKKHEDRRQKHMKSKYEQTPIGPISSVSILKSNGKIDSTKQQEFEPIIDKTINSCSADISLINHQLSNISDTTSVTSCKQTMQDITASLWGPPRYVTLVRQPNKSLGISIVGGKLDVCSTTNDVANKENTSTFISGIFIKHVLENSPAGYDGILKTGDRILAVNDIDLTYASHDRAVEVIRNAKSPVKFLIQSLICINTNELNDTTSISNPAAITTNLNDLTNNIKYSSFEANDINDNEDGLKVYDVGSEIIDEPNEYGYTLEGVKEKYSYLIEQLSEGSHKPEVFIFKLKRNDPNESLGLSLSGNVNLTKTSVFVCGIYANSIAHRHGRIKVGDQILEINANSLYGRAHSNVTPLIRNIKDLDVFLVVLRSNDNFNQMFKPTYQLLLSNECTSPSLANMASPIENILSKSVSSRIGMDNSTDSFRMDSDSSSRKLTKQLSFDEENRTASIRAESSGKEMRKITLKKGPTGFGIAISEDRFNRLIVRGLNPTGIAFRDGRMQVGDEIVAVNDMDVKAMKYDDVMNLLHQTQEPVRFHLTKPEILTTTGSIQSTATNSCNISNCPSGATSPSNQNARKRAQSQPAPLKNSTQTPVVHFNTNPITQSESTEKVQQTKQTITTSSNLSQANTNNDPKSNRIRVGEETLIEIERGKLGLGLSIVGGSDTQLPGIIIHDIYQSGAAYRDGRLTIGDQILKVNGVDLVNATHEQALNALRQTSDFVKLLIHRGFCPSFQVSELQQSTTTSSSSPTYIQSSLNTSNCVVLPELNNINDEKFLNIMNVDLNKKFGKGLGFSIIGRRDGSGVFISHIIEAGCAHKDGRLMVGDLILEVNGKDIRKSAYNDVAFLLKTLPQGKVTLKIGRLKTSASASLSNSTSQSANTSKTASRRNSITNEQVNDNKSAESTSAKTSSKK